LKTKIAGLSKQDERLDSQFEAGEDAYYQSGQKRLNPNADSLLAEAWYIGFELERIQNLWKNFINNKC